jgi:hypothetical protein
VARGWRDFAAFWRAARPDVWYAIAHPCEPWRCLKQAADLYLTSLKNYEAAYGRAATVIAGFQMTEKLKQKYASDPQVKNVHIEFSSRKWF